MRQQRAARRQEATREPNAPRTYKEAMNGNIHPINGDLNVYGKSPSKNKSGSVPDEGASKSDAASGPCTQCGKKSLPWGKVVLLNGDNAHVCGSVCQAKFDKERREKISASYRFVVDTESQKPAESIRPAAEVNRRRPRPAEH